MPWKGYKLTKQGKSIFRMGWREVSSDLQGGKMLSTMTMETDSAGSAETDTPSASADYRLFQREVSPFIVLLFVMFIFFCY